MCETPLGSLFEDVIYAFASIVRPATTADHNVATEERLHVTNEVLLQLSRQLGQNCRSYSGQHDVERHSSQRVIGRRITPGVACSVGSQWSGMRTWIAPR